MDNATAGRVRAKCIAMLNTRKEFAILRHDGAYKMHMSMNTLPRRCAGPRASELRDAIDRLRVSHTLTTGTGATVGALAAYCERRDIKISFTEESL